MIFNTNKMSSQQEQKQNVGSENQDMFKNLIDNLVIDIESGLVSGLNNVIKSFTDDVENQLNEVQKILTSRKEAIQSINISDVKKEPRGSDPKTWTPKNLTEPSVPKSSTFETDIKNSLMALDHAKSADSVYKLGDLQQAYGDFVAAFLSVGVQLPSLNLDSKLDTIQKPIYDPVSTVDTVDPPITDYSPPLPPISVIFPEPFSNDVTSANDDKNTNTVSPPTEPSSHNVTGATDDKNTNTVSPPTESSSYDITSSSTSDSRSA